MILLCQLQVKENIWGNIAWLELSSQCHLSYEKFRNIDLSVHYFGQCVMCTEMIQPMVLLEKWSYVYANSRGNY